MFGVVFYVCFQKERTNQLEMKSGVVTTKIVELQKSPFGKARQNDTLTDWSEFVLLSFTFQQKQALNIIIWFIWLF